MLVSSIARLSVNDSNSGKAVHAMPKNFNGEKNLLFEFKDMTNFINRTTLQKNSIDYIA